MHVHVPCMQKDLFLVLELEALIINYFKKAAASNYYNFLNVLYSV